MSVSNELSNIYWEHIYKYAKYPAFVSMCDCPDKYVKEPNWSCILKCFGECPSVFVPGA